MNSASRSHLCHEACLFHGRGEDLHANSRMSRVCVVLALRMMSLWKNNALPNFEEFFAAATVPDICFGDGKVSTANGDVQCSWDAMSSLTVPA